MKCFRNSFLNSLSCLFNNDLFCARIYARCWRYNHLCTVCVLPSGSLVETDISARLIGTMKRLRSTKEGRFPQGVGGMGPQVRQSMEDLDILESSTEVESGSLDWAISILMKEKRKKAEGQVKCQG